MRHGEAEHNLKKVFPLEEDGFKSNLTENGKEQASLAAQFFKEAGIEVVYASPFSRTRETAEIIALPRGLKVHKDRLLREIDIGLCEGLTKEEMKLKFPEFFEKRGLDYFGVPYPNGESPNDVRKRVLKFLKKIESVKGVVLIVSHNGFNRNLVNCLSSSSPEQVSGSEFGHGTVAEFDAETKVLELRES